MGNANDAMVDAGDARPDPAAGDAETTCGNHFVEADEQCDGTALGFWFGTPVTDCTALGYDSGAISCTSTCDGYDRSACVTAATCGDNVATGPELCDGTSNAPGTGVNDCTDFGYTGGTLGCAPDCLNWDVSGCTGGPMPPAGWTCPADAYDDAQDICNCGCGIVDPDCDNNTVAA